MKPQKITPREFDLFCEEARRAFRVLGLTDWTFSFHDKECSDENRAEVCINYRARQADFYVNEKWNKCVGQTESLASNTRNEELKETARHEVLHVLLNGLTDRSCCRDEIDGREHAVINVLQGILCAATKEKEEQTEAQEREKQSMRNEEDSS